MWIRTLQIDGYRHFDNQTIEFEKKSTLLAGANNSGKTSLIDLLKVVLSPDRTFGPEDFSAIRRFELGQKLIGAALIGEDEFTTLLAQEDFREKCPSINVEVIVEYDTGDDDIREFAEYLMDLEVNKSSFYFRFQFAPKREKVAAAFSDLFGEIQRIAIKESWSTVDDIETGSSSFLGLQSIIDLALIQGSHSSTYFADEGYTNVVPMERTKFARLFRPRFVKASRRLDDTIEDKSGALNTRLVDVAKEGDEWAKVLATLPEQVLLAIEATDIRKVTADETLKSLNSVIESISKTNGMSSSDLFLDFQVTEEHAIQLIAKAMRTRYSGIGISLGEGSQGLGYSNLILLHLETESFIRASSSPDSSYFVNLLVIEEPESHMHPQMQNAFIKHLYKRLGEVDRLQAFVTTHSNEMVRASAIQQLRVLKSSEGKARVVDLRKFHEAQVKGKSSEEQRLFNFLYSINFSDVLFADKVIMYEGDTERMYLQALIEERADLAGLRAQYVSYVQVGGAYAHIYKPLIVDTLGIKTVILTDLDYEKASETTSVLELQALQTTNATLNELFRTEGTGALSKPNLQNLFEQVVAETGLAHLPSEPLLAVAFQTPADGCARTLEEAILATLLKKDVWHEKTRQEWVEYRSDSGLRFSIPSAGETHQIRQIVASTANGKTDFMYSLILKNAYEEEAPPYVLAALTWLNS